MGLSAFSLFHVRGYPCVDLSPFSPGGWYQFILNLIVRLVCRKGSVIGGLIAKDSFFMSGLAVLFLSDLTVLPLSIITLKSPPKRLRLFFGRP